MDCLFHEDETKAMGLYIKELQAKGCEPIIYVSPDYDFVNAGLIKIAGCMPVTQKAITSATLNIRNGFTGVYYGTPIYVFDGLDSHTCCVMPQNKDYP